MKILRGSSKRVKKQQAKPLVKTQTGFLKNGPGASAEKGEQRGGLPPARLRRVMDYIEAHLHENLHLEEIADVLQMSPYHFGRLFKQSTGLTPHQYLVRQRIMKAKELLAEDGSSIAEIGRLLGFASHAHFTTVFRKLTGITPREYRAQNAK